MTKNQIRLLPMYGPTFGWQKMLSIALLMVTLACVALTLVPVVTPEPVVTIADSTGAVAGKTGTADANADASTQTVPTRLGSV